MTDTPALPPGAVITLRCHTVSAGRFRQMNWVRDLPPQVIDEPSALLGLDKAPSPSEALLAALGSSLAMGIHAGAIARDIIVHRLEVDLEGDTQQAGAVGTAPRPIGFNVIRVAVLLETNAPREVLSELVAHATLASPVANTLHNPVHLDVALSGY